MSSPFSSFVFPSCLRSVPGNWPNVRVRYRIDGNVASVMVLILPFLPYWVLTVSSRSREPARDVTLLYSALTGKLLKQSTPHFLIVKIFLCTFFYIVLGFTAVSLKSRE